MSLGECNRAALLIISIILLSHLDTLPPHFAVLKKVESGSYMHCVFAIQPHNTVLLLSAPSSLLRLPYTNFSHLASSSSQPMPHTAFLPPSPFSFPLSDLKVPRKYPSRMCTNGNQRNNTTNNNPSTPKKLPITNSPDSPPARGRKPVPNKTDTSSTKSNVYADGTPGDMAGGPPVGRGMGPRRGTKEKKVTRAAAIQKSQTFADAWAEQNQGRVDVWLIIGALTLLTPLLILAWAVATGVIPTGGLFGE